MIQTAIETLLRQKIGLETVSIGTGTINRAIQQCMTDSGITDPQVYLAKLQTSAQTLEDLIEAIVVPETWFFRDQEPFVCLSYFVQTEWLPTHSHEILRILSLPCATGEEPYSIGMALLEAGLAPRSFTIDAVDISKRALQKARQAVYGRNSFRGNDLSFRDRYFKSTAEGYQVIDSVKSTVNFMHGNLQDSQLLIEKLPYDVVFCRNVLIYFDDDAKAQAFQTLDRLLTPQGILFVGHAEAPQFFGTHFVSMRHPRAFAYRKVNKQKECDVAQKQLLCGTRPNQSSRASNVKLNPQPTYVPETSVKRTKADLSTRGMHQSFTHPLHPEGNLAPPQTLSDPADLTLEGISKLAQQGRSQEAMMACEIYLKHDRTNAIAYFLLGQLQQASGQLDQAERSFQKAIYLDPNQAEALNQLLTLKEKRGDLATAKVLRQRIQRLVQHGTPTAIDTYKLTLEFSAKSHFM